MSLFHELYYIFHEDNNAYLLVLVVAQLIAQEIPQKDPATTLCHHYYDVALSIGKQA